MDKLYKFGGNKIISDTNGKFVWPIITPEIEGIVIKQLHDSISLYNRSGIFEEFENKFASYFNAKHALLFNSGTSAIMAAMEALNLNIDDEVICPVYTFFATVSPAPYLGIKTVFCDADINGNINPDQIESLVTTKTKALVVTHMWGLPCDMDKIINICKKYDLKLIEDCSHAHGAKYKERLVGTFGDIACWSLQGQKIITGGEGGVLITNNDEYFNRALLLGHYNKRCKQEINKNSDLYKYSLTGFGLKLRAHPLAIAIANEQFNNLNDWIETKNYFAEKIIKELTDISFIKPSNFENKYPSWYALTFKYNQEKANNIPREVFVNLLQEEGLVEADVPNSTGLLNELPIFSDYKDVFNRYRDIEHTASAQIEHTLNFPIANKFYNSIFKIPVWVRKEDEGIVDKYIAGIKKVAWYIINEPSLIKSQIN